MRQILSIVFALMLCASLATARAATSACPIIDLMPKFWQVVDDSRHKSAGQQIAEFRRTLAVDQTDLYSESGLGFKSAEDLNKAILKSLAGAREHPDAVQSMSKLLESNLPSYINAFTRVFPDFKCDFPIYVTASLGQLDGAGRIVDHRPALIFGVDNIAEEFNSATLPIFIDHELFHRYHFQVSGFSDDKAANDVIWRALWAEGLATYASMALNPHSTLQDALFLPKDLVARAQPVLPSLISQLIPRLDQVDPQLFARFFSYHQPDGDVPSRSAYYIGALAAQRIAQDHSLFSLAHMDSSTVRVQLAQALAQIQKER